MTFLKSTLALKVSRMFMMLTKNVSNYCNKHSIVNASPLQCENRCPLLSKNWTKSKSLVFKSINLVVSQMVLCKSRDPGNHFSKERVSKEKIFALHANLSRIVRGKKFGWCSDFFLWANICNTYPTMIRILMFVSNEALTCQLSYF